ncbi:LOW QUALITY PROTEIN: mpv17-like protein 2 [Macrochelys suwanniensis]
MFGWGSQLFAIFSCYRKPLFSNQLILVTNTVSCGTLSATVDILQQTWEIRTNTKPKWGADLDSLYVCYWCIHQTINTLLVPLMVASPVRRGWYFMGLGSLEGQEMKENWQELKKFGKFYKADLVWPVVINFLFLTLYQVIYVAMVTL